MVGLRDRVTRFSTSVFLLILSTLRPWLWGWNDFEKKSEFVKLFDYEVVRSSIGLIRKIFLVSLDPKIFCLLMTYPGHIRLFIYFFSFKITFFSKKNSIKILKIFRSSQEIFRSSQEFFGVVLDYSEKFMSFTWYFSE